MEIQMQWEKKKSQKNGERGVKAKASSELIRCDLSQERLNYAGPRLWNQLCDWSLQHIFLKLMILLILPTIFITEN